MNFVHMMSVVSVVVGLASGAVAATQEAAHTGEGGQTLVTGLNEVNKASLICESDARCRVVITAMVSIVAGQSNYTSWKICARINDKDTPSCAAMMPVWGETPMAGTAVLVLKTPQPGRSYNAHVYVQVDAPASTLGKWSALYQQFDQ